MGWAGMAMQGIGMVGEGVGAYQGLNEANKQAKMLMAEATAEADRMKIDDDKFLATQESQYLKSGVILEGSPLLVIEEARAGQLAKRMSVREQGRTQANTLIRQGRNRLMGAILFPGGGGSMAGNIPQGGGAQKASAAPTAGTGGDRMNMGGGQYITNAGF